MIVYSQLAIIAWHEEGSLVVGFGYPAATVIFIDAPAGNFHNARSPFIPDI